MNLNETVAKGQDLAEYLDHIAWSGIVEPWLLRQKEVYQSWLVDVVLSHKPLVLGDGRQITAEQCAAHVEAINNLLQFFRLINGQHKKALEALQNTDGFENLYDLED